MIGMSMPPKPQQQTLSIRVSAEVRKYLENLRMAMADMREAVSTSDAAKMLLELARNDRLDHRLELAEMLQCPTEALANIRRKMEQRQGLSQAEWLLLARYVQIACEEPSFDPALPAPVSFAQVLSAFLAVRALRCDRATGLDRYYLGNLAGNRAPVSPRRIDDDVVPSVAGDLIQQLRASNGTAKPEFAGRNLYVGLRDEDLPGIVPLNEALSPYLPSLFRLAARGHWIRERRPLPTARGCSCGQQLNVEPLVSDGVRVSVSVGGVASLRIEICIPGRGIKCALVGYPRIREFGGMLERLEQQCRWSGTEFFGRRVTTSEGARFIFRQRRSGIELAFAPEEWQALRELIRKTLTLPGLKPVLDELSLVYGEI